MNELNQLEDPDLIEQYNNRKLTADKIRQHLNKVLNNPSISAKRWMWELVQNAKDVPNKYGRVSIKLEFEENALKFFHNGDPFTLSNIFSLIQQVSSKNSQNEDEEVTGKFGTGFICTHLLSKSITVSGIVKHKNVFRDFTIELDRSGDSSEQLIPIIGEALDEIRKIEDDHKYPRVPDYDSLRTEKTYSTSFTYPLDTLNSITYAESGIEDLVNTLPLTLVNIPKVKKVIVSDRVNEKKTKYSSKVIAQEGVVKKIEVRLGKEDSKYFLRWDTEEISLAVEVDGFESMSLIDNFKKIPNLCRDFPLIGSDRFYFPFIINGKEFNPTEDRDGIMLHSEEAKEHAANRQIIGKAFDEAKKFTEWLLDKDVKNRFVLANTRLPEEKWEVFSKDWYQKLQTDYRNFLQDCTLVENAQKGYSVFQDTVIPKNGKSDESKVKFFNIAKCLLGNEKVPDEKLILKWIRTCGPEEEVESWGRKVFYKLDDLLHDINEIGDLSSLEEKLDPGQSSIEWLNDVYEYLIKEKETEKLGEYAIIPNQNGKFRTLDEELHLEDKDSPIGDEFLDVLKELNQDWRVDLINREVELPSVSIDKLDMSDASEAINLVLRKEVKNSFDQYESVFLKKDDAQSILLDILQCQNPESEGKDFKSSVFKKGKELFKHGRDFKPVVNANSFRFNKALELYIQLINEQIEGFSDSDALSNQLELSIDDSLIWMNKYLTLLSEKQDFQKLLDIGNIIPNRYGDFIPYEDARNFGTEETPLDEELIGILKKLNEEEDWNKCLANEKIKLPLEPKKFDELGTAVDTSLRELEKEELANQGSLNDSRSAILSLIDWIGQNRELAEKYLPYSITRSDGLWFKFSMNQGVLRVVQKEENLDLLKKMEENDIEAKDLSPVIDSIVKLKKTGVDIVSEVQEYVDDRLKEEEHFHFMRKTGESMEDLFKELLSDLDLDIIKKHRGTGAFDFEFTNKSDNSKKVFLEIKSFEHGTSQPFKFAISQVRKSIESEDNFIVGFIERPGEEKATKEYLSDNMKFTFRLYEILTEVIHDVDNFENIINDEKEVKLVLPQIERPRVHVDFSLLSNETYSFDAFVDQIKEVLL